MLGPLLTTASWTIGNQRGFIRRGFSKSDVFFRRMLLPRYRHATINQKFPLAPRNVYFVHRPDHVREAFVNATGSLDAGSPYSFLRPYFGDESVFVMDGERHVDAKQRLYAMIKNDLAVESDDILFFNYSVSQYFPDGAYPVLPRGQSILSEFLIRSIFGVQGSARAGHIRDMTIGAANNASATLMILPSIVRITRRFGVGLEIRRQRLALRRFVLEELNGLDLLSDWETSAPTGITVSRSEIVDNLMTLLIAGFETAATTLAWLLYQFAADQDLQCAVRAEIHAREGDLAGYLKQDKTLLAACVHEALRLHPSIPFVLREVKSPHVMAGIALQADDYVLISIDEMQRRHFGDHGGDFRPSRFLEDAKLPKLIAFGGGVKMCPGRALAIQLLRLVTAMALGGKNFELTSQTNTKIARNRVSAAPAGGMVLSVRSLR